MEAHIALGQIGWTYLSIFIIWNVIFIAGLVFLWINRQHPSLRIRRLPLLFAGIIPLHTYGALCTLGKQALLFFFYQNESWLT